MPCRIDLNGTPYHFDVSADEMAEHLESVMPGAATFKTSNGLNTVVFGPNYVVAITDRGPDIPIEV